MSIVVQSYRWKLKFYEQIMLKCIVSSFQMNKIHTYQIVTQSPGWHESTKSESNVTVMVGGMFLSLSASYETISISIPKFIFKSQKWFTVCRFIYLNSKLLILYTILWRWTIIFLMNIPFAIDSCATFRHFKLKHQTIVSINSDNILTFWTNKITFHFKHFGLCHSYNGPLHLPKLTDLIIIWKWKLESWV